MRPYSDEPSDRVEVPPLDLDAMKARDAEGAVGQVYLDRHALIQEVERLRAEVPPLERLQPERSCCRICDSRKVCHVCGTQTLYACSDCRIDFGVSIYVCPTATCRNAHEQKCSARLRAEGEARRRVPRDIQALLAQVRETFDPGANLPADCNAWADAHWLAIDALEAALVRSSAPPPHENAEEKTLARLQSGATIRDDRIHADTSNGDK